MSLVRLIAGAALLALFWLAPARAEIAIQEVRTPGGFTAWLVEDRTIPFTALELRFRGGSSLDPPEQRGVVNLMTALLEEGAGDRDAQGFAQARDLLAARFGFSAAPDWVSVTARFLSENRDASVALLRSALVEPRFDADAVERVRGQVLSMIDANLKDPGSIAAATFNRLAFGKHPYGMSGDGSRNSVAALSRADILAAHRAALARDRVYIAAAGDIGPQELASLIDRLLGDLPASGAALPGRAEWLMKGGVSVVDFPSPQSLIRFGQKGIRRDAPDFFAAYILNEILGGSGFAARLMTEIREKRGLTYGVYSYLAPRDHAEIYLGSLSTANGTAAEAVALVREQWRKLAQDGVSAAELAATKTYLTGAYPLRFDGNGAIAQILAGMQMDRLPIDYVTSRNARIEAVTLDEVNRVARRLLQPDQLHFVVVGQPEGLESTPAP